MYVYVTLQLALRLPEVQFELQGGFSLLTLIWIVPDPGSRDRDVVLVKRGACWGNPKGGREFGLGRDWGGFGKGEISL